MFEQLAAKQIIRQYARLNGIYRNKFGVFDRRGGSIAVVVSIQSRNNGSLDASLRASWDGGNNYDDSIASGTFSAGADGVIYLLPLGVIPPDLRVVLDPTPDFDGIVEVSIRSAGLTRRLD